MKYPGRFLGQTDSNICEMRKVVIQTADPVSTIETTEIMVDILDSSYA